MGGDQILLILFLLWIPNHGASRKFLFLSQGSAIGVDLFCSFVRIVPQDGKHFLDQIRILYFLLSLNTIMGHSAYLYLIVLAREEIYLFFPHATVEHLLCSAL